MQEYEYSFNVDYFGPFVDYCESNGYQKISVENQNRVVYQNAQMQNIIARITTTKTGKKNTIVFDCKVVEKSDNDLKVSKESKEIVVNRSNRDGILSMLDTLGFYISADNTRTRYVYEKEGVRFEIDEYTRPKMNVVAIEGEKQRVDKVYNVVKNM